MARGLQVLPRRWRITGVPLRDRARAIRINPIGPTERPMQHSSPRSTATPSIALPSKRALLAGTAACALLLSAALLAPAPAAAQTKVAMLLPGSINDQS